MGDLCGLKKFSGVGGRSVEFQLTNHFASVSWSAKKTAFLCLPSDLYLIFTTARIGRSTVKFIELFNLTLYFILLTQLILPSYYKGSRFGLIWTHKAFTSWRQMLRKPLPCAIHYLTHPNPCDRTADGHIRSSTRNRCRESKGGTCGFWKTMHGVLRLLHCSKSTREILNTVQDIFSNLAHSIMQ